MKNFLTALILSISVFGAFAQQAVTPVEEYPNYISAPTKGIYFKDVNGTYDKFLGTWMYDNGAGQSLSITISKYSHMNYWSMDTLEATYVFTNNNEVIYNTTAIPVISMFGGTYFLPDNDMEVEFILVEPAQDWERISQTVKLTIHLHVGAPATLDWRILYEPRIDDAVPPQIPYLLTLTKV